jgi:glycosyltransferase involved in cell wall biosynthesis
MKSKGKRINDERRLDATNDLIREVAENVILRSVPQRRSKKYPPASEPVEEAVAREVQPAGQEASAPVTVSEPALTDVAAATEARQIEAQPPAPVPQEIPKPAREVPAPAPVEAHQPKPASVPEAPKRAKAVPPPQEAAVAAPVPVDQLKPIESYAPKAVRATKERAAQTPKPAANPSGQKSLALFCYDDPANLIGQYACNLAGSLAQKGLDVHVFTRKSLPPSAAGTRVHELGECAGENLLASVQNYTSAAKEAFLQTFGANANAILVGFEWGAIQILRELNTAGAFQTVLIMHSLEQQRSDMRSDLSRKIQAIETSGLNEAGTVLYHQGATAEFARKLAPACASRLTPVRIAFPVDEFKFTLDAGEVKKRVQVGPIDPLILFIGPLDERHGPDILLRSAPSLLPNHKQARFAFVGDGPLQWPLRVQSRYLLLDYVTRFVGHLSGRGLHELIHAAEVIVAPSRERTEEWPVLAAWAAQKPVIVTHNATASVVEHDRNGLLVYPSENSLVWGLDKLLNNADLRATLGRNGHKKLLECYGWNGPATQIEELMNAGRKGPGAK